MEFEDDTPITDEQRLRAEAKQLNIQPLDPSIKPEERSEDYTAAEHLRGPALANVSNDVEQNAPAVQPTPSLVSPTASKKAPSLRSVRTGTAGAIIFLAAAVAAIVIYALN
jgi:hypothetical protein